MKKIDIKKIIESLPEDYSKHTTRDVSVLTCSVFAETYSKTIYQEFRAKFSSNLWVVRGDIVNFYRPQSEHDNFDKIVGERIIKKNIGYAKNLADTLIQHTDWINKFIKKNKGLRDFLRKKKQFIDKYRKFFAYHQAVYWGGEYALKNSKSKAINQKIKILKRAYEYNEMVVPNVEKYFKKLKISNFLYDELNSKILKEKINKRFIGVLFIGKKRVILNRKESNKLEDLISKKEKKREKNIKEISGISITPKLYKGRVRLIKNPNKLNEIRNGDVLVTTMTRPQFNKYLKNVGAIITDDGGMLCHAAILAREFKIPCIVGTKIATKVLKTGDRVEINSKKGIVRILNN